MFLSEQCNSLQRDDVRKTKSVIPVRKAFPLSSKVDVKKEMMIIFLQCEGRRYYFRDLSFCSAFLGSCTNFVPISWKSKTLHPILHLTIFTCLMNSVLPCAAACSMSKVSMVLIISYSIVLPMSMTQNV